MAGRSLINTKSSIITGVPKILKHGDKVEGTIIQMMDIEAEKDATLAALVALNLISRQILYYSFRVLDNFSNYRTNREVGYSERNVQRMKSGALVEFAEAYKYERITTHK